MPLLPVLEMVPVFEMPPEKVVIETTPIALAAAAKILPLLLMPPAKVSLPPAEMPPSPAEIVPLLAMPPWSVVTLTLMPSWADEIAPLLLTPPVRTDTEPMLMPMLPAEMVPLLVTPPRKLVTEPMAMPVPNRGLSAEIVPVFMMLPENVETAERTMPPLLAEEIVPLLLMLPEKLVRLTIPFVFPTRMPRPVVDEIVPALDMPPLKLGPLIEMAFAVAMILLALSREIPPAIVPVLLIPPVIVPLLNVMPEGLIVPSFVIEPLKLVLVTQKPATVVPIGLSVVALTCTQAAHAEGIPTPINSGTRELDASKLRLRYRCHIRPHAKIARSW